MILEFLYTSRSGTLPRKVFVLKETDLYIEGLDLSLLSESDINYITSTYKEVTPTSSSEKLILEGFKPEWDKAYRRYNRAKIATPRKLD